MSELQVIAARERDLGGFSVRRVLPADGRQMVGPFIFFDHLGPAEFSPGSGIDVRPHPHIALATVTYLYSGALRHRDSLGTVQDIRPGDVNWMTAGRGIAHSERTPPAERAAGAAIHGIQSWFALPDGQEDVEPSFAHHAVDDLPLLRLDGVQLRIIAGHAFGLRSPVATLWPTLYADARLRDEAVLEVPYEHTERAAYVVSGAIAVCDHTVLAGQMVILQEARTASLRAIGDSVVMLLGGERFPTPRTIWWNFVASTRERIEEAKLRWAAGQFAPVPAETEFIPLPKN
jgi:redox-sensitive bicupin YhaK (pirin superfamily)